MTDSRGACSVVKCSEVRDCPVKYYWFKYATTGIIDLVRISGHAYKKPEEIGHACLGNRVDVFPQRKGWMLFVDGDNWKVQTKKIQRFRKTI